MSRENRKAGRVRRRVRVMLIDHAGGEFNGVTSNLSTTGFSMNLGQPLPVSMPVTGRLFPPESAPVAFAAEVRWVRASDDPRNKNETHSMGLLFLGPPQDGYGALVGVRMPTLPVVTDARGRPVANPGPIPKTSSARPARSSKRPRLRAVSVEVTTLKAGLEVRTMHIVEPGDLAVAPTVGAGSLSPSRVASWIERAAAKALRGALPHRVVTAPLTVEVQIAPRGIVSVGACVTTHAKLVEIGSGSSWLRFTATIKEETRHLASGTQVSEVLEVAQK